MTSQPPPIPVTSLQYASPVGYGAANEGQWRDRDQIVAAVRPGGTIRLPPRCVKSNAPTDNLRGWRKTMSWHHPALFALIVSPLIYIIVALCVRKQVTVDAGLCAAHRDQRRTRITIGWLIAGVGLACVVAAFYFASDNAWRRGNLGGVFGVIGTALLVGAAIWAVIATRVVTVRKVTPQMTWLGGAGPEFLASLPG